MMKIGKQRTSVTDSWHLPVLRRMMQKRQSHIDGNDRLSILARESDRQHGYCLSDDDDEHDDYENDNDVGEGDSNGVCVANLRHLYVSLQRL